MTALHDLAWPRRTARLLLRPARAADAAALWRYTRHPVVAEWETVAPSDEVAFTARSTDPDRLATLLAVEHEGAVIGDLMLQVGDAPGQAEVAEARQGVQGTIGWAFDPAHHGHGYATEAAEELLGVAFDALGLRRVVAACVAANTPSWRLMERLGMRRETTAVAAALHRTRGWVDTFTYALLAPEWRARQT